MRKARRELMTCDAGFGEFGVDGGDGAVEVDGAAGVAQDECGKAEAARVESGVADTVVVGETGEEDASEIVLAQIVGKTSRRGAVILEEGRIGIDLRAEAFAQDQLGLRELERRMKLRAARALHAMRRPERLRAVRELDGFVGLFAGMRRGKGRMIGRMPVLSKNDVLESRRDAMDGRDDLVAAGNGERAAGAKIILHVDNEEDVVRIDLHQEFPQRAERENAAIICAGQGHIFRRSPASPIR